MSPPLVTSTFSHAVTTLLIMAHRLELARSCAKGMDLTTCPDFSDHQPYGPAEWPKCPARYAYDDCPVCDYNTHDLRRRRVIVVRKAGLRVGVGPDRKGKARCGLCLWVLCYVSVRSACDGGRRPVL